MRGSGERLSGDRAFFIDESNEIISDIKEIIFSGSEISKATFTLSPKVSSATNCMLALQSSVDDIDELQQLIPFEINMIFGVEFDFSYVGKIVGKFHCHPLSLSYQKNFETHKKRLAK